MSKKIAKKNNIIAFRLSDNDMELYRSVCTDYQLRLSSFIRDAIKYTIDKMKNENKQQKVIDKHLLRTFFELGYDCRDNNNDEEKSFEFYYANYFRDKRTTATDNALNP